MCVYMFVKYRVLSGCMYVSMYSCNVVLMYLCLSTTMSSICASASFSGIGTYVCMQVCVYAHIYTYMYVNMPVCVYMYMYMHMYTCAYMYLWFCIRTQLCAAFVPLSIALALICECVCVVYVTVYVCGYKNRLM